MKKPVLKVTACILSAAILFGGIGTAAYALNLNQTAAAPAQTDAAPDPTVSVADLDGVLSKDETVYVIAGPDGSVEQIIVSDWVKNPQGLAQIKDRSDLEDLENVKTDGGYTLSGDGAQVWNADGGDLYYQGTTQKALPVDLSVSYTLDGKSIDPDDLAGKSGRVTIRFDYTNNQYEYVEINGQQEKIYVPFAMVTGLVLDSDRFTNVTVSNGKIFSDGNQVAVVGMAFPGLQENLAVDKEDFDMYPYPFLLSVRHQLTEKGFITEFLVRNTGATEMPFCIGAHTAFRCPLLPGERFEDYELVFDQAETAGSILVTADGTLSHNERFPVLEQSDTIPLDYHTFDLRDTLIFDGLRSHGVSLRHKASGHGVHMAFEGFPMIAFWTKPNARAPYLCLEPWHGCAALDNDGGNFEDKPHCIILAPGKSKSLRYTVEMISP